MARYRIEERTDAFRYCANQLEWKFKPDDHGMLSWLLDFKLFKVGHRKKIQPVVILESDDLGFTCMFDYQYTISTNNSSRTYRQTVYFKYSKSIALPHFILVPEKWYHRIGTYFGMQDIDFVEYPQFSDQYLLRGADEDYIRYHFNHPDMMRFFGTQNFYSMEGMNYLMVLYINDRVLERNQMTQLVRIGNTFYNYFKEKTPRIELPQNLELGDLK